MIELDATRKIGYQAVIKYSNKFTIPLPQTFLEDNEIKQNDELEIYRERVNGRDAIILMPRKEIQEATLN